MKRMWYVVLAITLSALSFLVGSFASNKRKQYELDAKQLEARKKAVDETKTQVNAQQKKVEQLAAKQKRSEASRNIDDAIERWNDDEI